MRIGVLELLNPAINTPWPQKGYAHVALKQNASIVPQAVSVWCRDLGHEVFYATYYGQSDPKRLLPSDLELVFISCHTQASPLAEAEARKGEGGIVTHRCPWLSGPFTCEIAKRKEVAASRYRRGVSAPDTSKTSGAVARPVWAVS